MDFKNAMHERIWKHVYARMALENDLRPYWRVLLTVEGKDMRQWPENPDIDLSGDTITLYAENWVGNEVVYSISAVEFDLTFSEWAKKRDSDHKLRKKRARDRKRGNLNDRIKLNERETESLKAALADLDKEEEEEEDATETTTSEAG